MTDTRKSIPALPPERAVGHIVDASGKDHWLLLILFLATLATVAVILPAVNTLTDAAVTHSSTFHRVLKYRPSADGTPSTYDMGRVARRLLTLTALVLLFLFRKRLRIVDLATVGLRRGVGYARELALGTALGLGSFALLLTVLTLLGAWRLESDSKPVLVVLAKSVLSGAVLGLVEEILFRGFLLKKLAMSLGSGWAIFWSSAFYSILHFFRAKVPVAVGFDPLVGIKTVGSFFAPVAAEPAILLNSARWDDSILPGAVGFFLVGVVLGYAFVRTKRLYLSIGIHAGWVFVLKFDRVFIGHSTHGLRWLYGGKHVVTGVMGWLFLLAFWALLAWMLRRGGAGGGSGGGPGW